MSSKMASTVITPHSVIKQMSAQSIKPVSFCKLSNIFSLVQISMFQLFLCSQKHKGFGSLQCTMLTIILLAWEESKVCLNLWCCSAVGATTVFMRAACRVAGLTATRDTRQLSEHTMVQNSKPWNQDPHLVMRLKRIIILLICITY